MYLQDIPILYINLKRDVKRREVLEKDLTDIRAKFTRIDAVYGKDLYDPKYRKTLAKKLGVSEKKLLPSYWFNRRNFKTMDNKENSILAKVGCYLSHLLAYKTALRLGYTKVLILEDDAMPLRNAFKSFSIPNDADIFYLGGGYFHNDNNNTTFTAKDLRINIDTDVLKICCTFAYVVPNVNNIKSLYNLFMSVFKEGGGHDKTDDWKNNTTRLRAQAADFMLINFVQKAGKTYIQNPPMVSCREFASNIADNRQKYKLSYFLNNAQQYKMIGHRGLYNGLYKLLD